MRWDARKVPQKFTTACAMFQLFWRLYIQLCFHNISHFLILKSVFPPELSLCHLYYTLICDISSPYSAFLLLELFSSSAQLFSTIRDLTPLCRPFSHPLACEITISRLTVPTTSKKSVRHSRATLKVPSCFISQIAKVSKVSQRDSLDKGRMKADLLWVSHIFALIYWHKDTCVMCVLHMMVADLNVFLARASWTKTGQTSIQV